MNISAAKQFCNSLFDSRTGIVTRQVYTKCRYICLLSDYLLDGHDDLTEEDSGYNTM